MSEPIYSVVGIRKHRELSSEEPVCRWHIMFSGAWADAAQYLLQLRAEGTTAHITTLDTALFGGINGAKESVAIFNAFRQPLDYGGPAHDYLVVRGTVVEQFPLVAAAYGGDYFVREEIPQSAEHAWMLAQDLSAEDGCATFVVLPVTAELLDSTMTGQGSDPLSPLYGTQFPVYECDEKGRWAERMVTL